MKPIFAVEYSVKTGEYEFKEESVPIHDAEELLAFVAPGGGCESIPADVAEIQIVYIPVKPPSTLTRKSHKRSVSDVHSILQLGTVFFNGPLAEIVRTAQLIIDKSGDGELSQSFVKVIGADV